jgi:hypothetical protein
MKPHVVCWQTSLIRTDGALNAIDMPNLFSANRQQFPGFLPTLPFFVGCFYASWQKNFMADFETSPFACQRPKHRSIFLCQRVKLVPMRLISSAVHVAAHSLAMICFETGHYGSCLP